jgi:hypothetical protein
MRAESGDYQSSEFQHGDVLIVEAEWIREGLVAIYSEEDRG